MIDKSHIENFSPALKELLTSELTKGNEIVETSMGWPSKDTIIIFLRHPFMASYTPGEVVYRELNDPHWWKAEYYDPGTEHILACKYS